MFDENELALDVGELINEAVRVHGTELTAQGLATYMTANPWPFRLDRVTTRVALDVNGMTIQVKLWPVDFNGAHLGYSHCYSDQVLQFSAWLRPHAARTLPVGTDTITRVWPPLPRKREATAADFAATAADFAATTDVTLRRGGQ